MLRAVDQIIYRLRYSRRKKLKAFLFLLFALVLWLMTYLFVSFFIRWALFNSNEKLQHDALLQQWTQRQEEQKPLVFDWDETLLQDFNKDHRVLWMAPFWSRSGYGTEAIAFVLGLNEKLPGRTLVWQYGDKVSQDSVAPEISRRLEKLRSRTPSTWDKPVVSICHCTPYAWAPVRLFRVCPPRNSVIKIARTMFETDSVPTSWIPKLNAMDKIWVPTKFHVEVFARAGVESDKLVAIPEPVDSETFDPHLPNPPYKLPKEFEDAQFVFLSVFKWEERKGWKYLIRAFFDEFKHEPKIKLFILSKAVEEGVNPHKELNFLLGTGDHESIYLSDDHLKPKQLPGLYKAVDAFVLPSNGEGWGRPLVEAMCMELPSIATNWSGPTEFMTEQNSFPLKIEPELGPVDVKSMGGQDEVGHHKWAIPSITHLRQLMRYIVTHPQEAKMRGVQARKDMVERFNIDVVSNIVHQEIEKSVDDFVQTRLPVARQLAKTKAEQEKQKQQEQLQEQKGNDNDSSSHHQDTSRPPVSPEQYS